VKRRFTYLQQPPVFRRIQQQLNIFHRYISVSTKDPDGPHPGHRTTLPRAVRRVFLRLNA
jgi:hypothetical protein